MDEIPITFFTNSKVQQYLEQAVASGLYGKTVAEAAERMVARSLEDMVIAGQLDRIDSEPEQPEQST